MLEFEALASASVPKVGFETRPYVEVGFYWDAGGYYEAGSAVGRGKPQHYKLLSEPSGLGLRRRAGWRVFYTAARGEGWLPGCRERGQAPRLA